MERKSKQNVGGEKPMKLFLFTLLLSVFLTPATSVCNAEMVSISKQKVNMRSGPGTKHDVLWELGKGYPLMVIATKGKWVMVKDFENDVGWIYQPLTSKTPHLIVKKKKINIRNGPGKNYRVISTASHGTVFRTLKQIKGWAKVEDEDGLIGWILRKLLWGW
jgi:SH3-like domain-containing protein